MNYYNYLRKELNKNANNLRNKKTIKILIFLNSINYVLEILFSIFFISYFVKLSNYLELSKQTTSKVSDKWIEQQVNINESLLVCMIVFWVIFITVYLWEFWTLINFKNNFFNFNNEFNNIFIYIWIFSILSLFICLIGLINLSFNLFYLIKLKKF